MEIFRVEQIFNIDRLSILMTALVVYITLCVVKFSWHYMAGDKKRLSFLATLFLVVFSVVLMVSVDHLILFFTFWCFSNILLICLMIHKASWKAAKMSGILSGKNYLFGAFCLGCAFVMLYWQTGLTSINEITQQYEPHPFTTIALCLILLTSMTQSAIWPFHRWLISSLNSPTPVSALMHAGLVNGGGILLVRFAPLYLQHEFFLTGIFIIGLVSALIGTLWKLMQNDVKRMLACSTMGQMGFMLAQCGLGLFPAAVAHLIWHGLFKAYLFLNSGSAAQEKRFDVSYPPSFLSFIGALTCGIFGSFSFAYSTNKSWGSGDTTFVLLVIAVIAISQFVLPFLRAKTLKAMPLGLSVALIIGFIYGCSVNVIAWIMGPMNLMRPQPLNAIHILGLFILTLAWIYILFARNIIKKDTWKLKAYVMMLNASQPHPLTTTPHRNTYTYK